VKGRGLLGKGQRRRREKCCAACRANSRRGARQAGSKRAAWWAVMCAELTSGASVRGLRGWQLRREGSEDCVGGMRAVVGGWWADNEGWGGAMRYGLQAHEGRGTGSSGCKQQRGSGLRRRLRVVCDVIKADGAPGEKIGCRVCGRSKRRWERERKRVTLKREFFFR
jgi:hypothetical protein